MNPFDVNDDGVVSPIDALALINHFNSLGVGIQSEGLRHHQSRFYLDVSGDRVVSALDALMIINQLNARTATRPEGESAGSGQYFAIPHSAQSIVPVQKAGRARGPNLSEPTATGSSSTATLWQPTRLNRIHRDEEKASQDWESLLDAIARDATEVLLSD